MVKMIDGVAEKVLPWFTLASMGDTIEFTPNGTDYLTRKDIVLNFTEQALDTFYEESVCMEDWNGCEFAVKVNGSSDGWFVVEDDEIEGMTLEEIADYLFDCALEWFEDDSPSAVEIEVDMED